MNQSEEGNKQQQKRDACFVALTKAAIVPGPGQIEKYEHDNTKENTEFHSVLYINRA